MASSTTAEVESSFSGAVAQEVAKIRDSAARLGELLAAEMAGNSAVGAVLGDLLQSSSRAFSLVNCTLPEGDIGSPSPREASSKKRRTSPAGDGRGGCRRRSNSSAKKVFKSESLDDGQTWRKYGQKSIQNSNNPRSYFRCTHKYDQGCLARRQVQQAEDDPKTFVITYDGEHTCRDPATASDHMASASGFRENACLIRFGASSSASFGAPPKQESTEEDVASNLTTTSTSSSSEFYSLGLPAMLPADERPALGATAAGDVTSGIHDDLELELLIDSCLGGVLGFDDGRFYYL
ncbi:WRKY transcription factor WRKY24-like [Zingiber officinale]|uniref:WRKY transcription factor WRKY24-like n=1 Tax=Zingiber officinale TaxID=94328 RepID=UPI001C4D3F59|nr:WRKY transcription factor WRKY24-like [Zingiber officinale]